MASASLGGVGGFTPAQLPGLVLWLRADLGITLNGASVSTWADQSGQGNNATQGTAADQPTYIASDAGYGGAPTVRFSGSPQFLQFATHLPAQPFTVFVVGESSSGSGQQEFFADVGVNACILFHASATPWSVFAGSLVSSGNTVQGAAQAFTGVFNGASSALYVNGAIAASGNAGAANPSGIQTLGASTGGGANFLIGKIAEFIFFSRALSTSEIAQVNGYLLSRYALSS